MNAIRLQHGGILNGRTTNRLARGHHYRRIRRLACGKNHEVRPRPTYEYHSGRGRRRHRQYYFYLDGYYSRRVAGLPDRRVHRRMSINRREQDFQKEFLI